MTDDPLSLGLPSARQLADYALKIAAPAGLCAALWFSFGWFQVLVLDLFAWADHMTVDAFRVYQPLWGFGANNIAVGLTILVLYAGVRFVERQRFWQLLSADGQISFRLFARGFLTWMLVMSIVRAGFSIAGWRAPLEPGLVPGFGMLAIVALTFLIQTPAEELIFRGYLRTRIAALMPDRFYLPATVSVLASSWAFAAIHFYNTAGTAQMFVLGLGCSIVRLIDGRLERGMGLHAALNIMIAVVFGLNGTHRNWPSLMRLPPAPRADWVDVAQLGITFVLMLLVSYGWPAARRQSR